MTGSITLGFRNPLGAALTCVMLAMAVSGAANARLAPDDDGVPIAARAVLEALSGAMIRGDHGAVAELVHPDGIRVGLGPDPERISELTPGQAHYYFKSLFHSRRSLGFEYLRHHAGTQERIVVRAVWRYRGVEQEQATAQRLLATVVHHDHGWRLTELTALRGG